MKNDFERQDLFSCPIYKIRVDPTSYDKEKIINDILYNKSLKNTRNNSKNFEGCNIHHSYEDKNNEIFRIINYEKLNLAYLEIFNDFFNNELNTIKNFTYKFKIQNYLAVTENQWMSSHNHLGDESVFATVHYLNFEKDHNFTNFINPAIFAPFIKHIQPDMYNIIDRQSIKNSYMFESFKYSVEEDDMIIFPSTLKHEILPQKPIKEPRITIATNIKINESTIK